MTSSSAIKTAHREYEPKTGADPHLAPLLFLHGLSASKEHWSNIPQIVADHTKRKAYALDARNHGDSEWSDDFDEELLVEDLFRYMESMDIGRAVLIGHSMGGRTAVKAALRQPEKFEMVIIEECSIKALTPQKTKELLYYLLTIEEALALTPAELDDVDASKFIWSHLRSKMPVRPHGNKEKNYTIPMKTDSEGRRTLKLNIKGLTAALKNPKAATATAEGVFEGPAYFIFGTESTYGMPAEEEHIRKFFPKSELIGIDGAGHDVHGEFPELFTESLLKCF